VLKHIRQNSLTCLRSSVVDEGSKKQRTLIDLSKCNLYKSSSYAKTPILQVFDYI
jgi:hypothetical protein